MHPARWREVRSEVAVKREPSSDGMLSQAKPMGLAHGWYFHLLKGTQYYVAVPARRGWQRLPQRRGEVCLSQGLDSRKEVRTGGCHSPSSSGTAGEALGAAPVLEDLTHLQEEEEVEWAASCYTSPPSPLVLQCRRKNSAAWSKTQCILLPSLS